MSVQAVKAVEIGRGVTAAESLGSVVHDPIGFEVRGTRFEGQAENEDRVEPVARFTGFTREQNNAGGIEGGFRMARMWWCGLSEADFDA